MTPEATVALRIPPLGHPMLPWVLAALAAKRLADKGDNELMDMLIAASVDPEGDARDYKRKQEKAKRETRS